MNWLKHKKHPGNIFRRSRFLYFDCLCLTISNLDSKLESDTIQDSYPHVVYVRRLFSIFKIANEEEAFVGVSEIEEIETKETPSRK